MNKPNCIVVLGPTASGKTHLACQLAIELNGEIISADSRQVYKGLNIGTGKDLEEYTIFGKSIPYHLIDVKQPNEQFYLHDFVEELKKAFLDIRKRNHIPIICGGTGLYLDALKKDYSLTLIKENQELRNGLKDLPKEELIIRLKKYPKELWHQVDLNSTKRIIRGIEIADYLSIHKLETKKHTLPYVPYYIGLTSDIETRRDKISERLENRIKEGLITEVEDLVKSGVSHERLQFFGLEYKFVSRFLLGELSKDEMIEQLKVAIYQYAKRQMTWFRKMEKEGVVIHWMETGVEAKSVAETLKPLF